MCRFIGYIGNPLILDDVLFKPSNSLVKQSIHAKEKDEPLNGDGFGLGWYAQDIDSYPGLFRSIHPAWNDLNLQYIAAKLRSNCFFAHIRSATIGGITQFNCHPFHYKQYLFMHNGHIGNFEKIKRYLREQLSDEIYNWIQGDTDSEHLFALFLDDFIKEKLHFNPENVSKVLLQAIKKIDKLKKKHHCKEVSRINAVLTNGKNIIAIRYMSDKKTKPATLYYAIGDHYEYHDNACHIKPAKTVRMELY